MNGLPIDAKPIEILLVEDNENDVILTQEGFKLAKLNTLFPYTDSLGR